MPFSLMCCPTSTFPAAVTAALTVRLSIAGQGPRVVERWVRQSMVVVTTARQAEFARACVGKLLSEGAGTEVAKRIHYVGLWRPDQVLEIKPQIAGLVYSWWDESSSSPPKMRPEENRPAHAVAAPPLTILARDGADHPIWPATLDSKFMEGTEDRLRV